MISRLLIIADVGGEETRHVGDEAMLEANLDALRTLAPDALVTVISRDPAWTAARYGVESVAPFGFIVDATEEHRRGRLQQLIADAASGRAGNETIAAVAAADALVISGGGNLSSSWPDLLYERVALLEARPHFRETGGPDRPDARPETASRGATSSD